MGLARKKPEDQATTLPCETGRWALIQPLELARAIEVKCHVDERSVRYSADLKSKFIRFAYSSLHLWLHFLAIH